jgi:hypothetical protein
MSAIFGCGDDDRVGQIGDGQPVPGFVLQVGEQRVVAWVA